jgi:hypothetical protein
MKFNGKASLTIDGKEREFIWNMASLCELGDLLGVSIDGMIGHMIAPKFSFIRDFLYVGAVEALNKKGEKVTFTRRDAASWLEEVGIEKTLLLLADAFRSPEEKNPIAPETGHSENGLLKTA